MNRSYKAVRELSHVSSVCGSVHKKCSHASTWSHSRMIKGISGNQWKKKNWYHSNHVKVGVPCVVFSAAALSSVETKESGITELEYQKLPSERISQIIEEADSFYSQHLTDKTYDYLKQYDNVWSAQIFWRLARATCDKAKHCDAKSDERRKLMFEAYEYAKKGLDMDENCGACHRWAAVMLNYKGDYESISEKIIFSYDVQKHFQRAIELDSKDATSMHCLGQWCYYFAEMSWYTKKAAALVFGKPPSSTFAEALHYFELAESTDPNFYSMNHIMLGKVYRKLNDLSKAREHFIKARDLPVRTPDDEQAHAEALQFLKELN